MCVCVCVNSTQIQSNSEFNYTVMCKNTLSSEESFVVMDYATLENVEVEVGQGAEGRMSPPAKNSSSHLSFRLLMSRNSDGRVEQMCLVAESRYCCSHLPSAMNYIIYITI